MAQLLSSSYGWIEFPRKLPLSSALHAAGDRGFDPLRLGEGSAEKLVWYKEGELYNGRWAMMAVVGILFTDALGLPKFWLAGAEVCAVSS